MAIEFCFEDHILVHQNMRNSFKPNGLYREYLALVYIYRCNWFKHNLKRKRIIVKFTGNPTIMFASTHSISML